MKDKEINKEVEKFYYKGLDALDDGNWLMAVQHFRKCHEIDPSYAPAYHELADIYHYNGQFEAALEELKDALVIDPHDVEAIFALGNTYLSLDRPMDALRVFKRLEALDPGFGPELYYNIGITYAELTEPDKAIDYLRSAVESDPSYYECLEALGRIYIDEERYTEARDALLQVVDVDPGHINAHHMLGVVYSKMDDWSKAVDEWETVLKLAPGAGDAMSELGRAFIRMGEYEKAVETLRKALEVNPDDVEARIGLGAAFLKGEHFVEAIRELEKARLQDPGNPSILEYLKDARKSSVSKDGSAKE